MFIIHIDDHIKLEYGIRISLGYSIKVFQMRVLEAVLEDFQRNIFLIFVDTNVYINIRKIKIIQVPFLEASRRHGLIKIDYHFDYPFIDCISVSTEIVIYNTK